MVDRAEDQRMTVEEFLDYEGEPDTRYELVEGVIHAMAPAQTTHGEIVMNCGFEIQSCLRKRPPCRAQSEAGIAIEESTFFQPDIAVTCAPPGVSQTIEAPTLIVEVLSPSTREHDLGRKLDAYKALETVQEIWIVDSERRWLQAWVREDQSWVGRDLIGSADFESPVLEGLINLDEVYRNTTL
ncbi:MAG: Uma2 family endonuclease [Pseudomonadota bacterium]